MNSHTHPLPNGEQTGKSVNTLEPGLHFHPLPDGGSTAIAADYIGHTHKISGTNNKTSAPNPS